MAKRLQKEYESICKNNETFTVNLINNDLRAWHVHFEGAKSTIYAGEKYTLQFRFSEQYVYPATRSPSSPQRWFSWASPPTMSTSTQTDSFASQFCMTVTDGSFRVEPGPDCGLGVYEHPVDVVECNQESR